MSSYLLSNWGIWGTHNLSFLVPTLISFSVIYSTCMLSCHPIHPIHPTSSPHLIISYLVAKWGYIGYISIISSLPLTSFSAIELSSYTNSSHRNDRILYTIHWLSLHYIAILSVDEQPVLLVSCSFHRWRCSRPRTRGSSFPVRRSVHQILALSGFEDHRLRGSLPVPDSTHFRPEILKSRWQT